MMLRQAVLRLHCLGEMIEKVEMMSLFLDERVVVLVLKELEPS